MLAVPPQSPEGAALLAVDDLLKAGLEVNDDTLMHYLAMHSDLTSWQENASGQTLDDWLELYSDTAMAEAEKRKTIASKAE